MPSKQIGLQNWNIINLENLLTKYRVDSSHLGFTLRPLVNEVAYKYQFLDFKL